MAGQFCNTGETKVGNIILQKNTVTDLYMGLFGGSNMAIGAENVTLGSGTGSIEELTVTGYARQQIVSANWTEGVTKGEFTNDEYTFTPTESYTIQGYFITDESSGAGSDVFAYEFFFGLGVGAEHEANKSVKITPKITLK